MKKTLFLLFTFLLLLSSCSKSTIDSSNPISFRNSINKLTSGLDTRQQVKFTEALYIIKTFGSDEETYTKQMEYLMNVLSDKGIKDVFQIADEIAEREGIDWSSTAPPSLGEMNVFETITASEVDPNEIIADDEIYIQVKPTAYDSIKGPQAVRIIPKLMKNGNPIYFTKATLPTTLEISSGDKVLLKRKNLIVDSDFNGYYLSYSNLNYNDIEDGRVDILITIKASNKMYKTIKRGVRINERVFKSTDELKTITYDEFSDEDLDSNDSIKVKSSSEEDVEKPIEKPKKQDNTTPQKTVQKFLSSLSAKNLKEAYKTSANPSWGNYDKFSNPNSGFGSVDKLSVKSVKTNSANENTASVDAVYEVEDKNGDKTSLNVTFGLKKVDGVWKISSYTIK